jgi:apolipoprotein N-acyltransferase
MGWRGWPVWTAALITLGLYGYGGQAVPDTAPLRQDGLVVRIVQPNATQETKWTADGMRAQYIRALQSTAQEGDYDVVIWPEAAVPQLVGEDARSWGGRLYQWQDIARVTQNRPALIGSRRVAWLEDPQWYNTLAVMTGGGVAQHYDKHHLVPFGEYIPLAQYLPGLGLQGLASALSNLGGSMQAGAGPRVIEAQGLPPFLPLICYEAIFPQHLRSAGPRPDWIVHVTNDAWFGNWVGPYQHLTQARFRAIEQGLPIARAANTGISAMIDPWGRIQSAIPLNTDGALDAPLPAPSNMPLYSKIGDGPFALGFGFVIGLLLVSRRYV